MFVTQTIVFPFWPQIILLGVCLGPSSGAPRPSDDLTLQPLPEYTVSSDSVTMCCITASEDGRIFMGGRDGQLHELLYSTGSGWQKRCQKVTHAGGLANVLARWVVPSVFRRVLPLRWLMVREYEASFRELGAADP